jgi:hypothetical protein
MTTNTTIDAVRIPVCEAVRTALIDLLTTGPHHDAATTATLRAVAATRTRLAQHTGRNRPVARYALAEDRHTALSSALGDIAHALRTERPIPDYPQLYTGLSTLAAVALAWLDALPHPDDDPADEDDEHYHTCADPEPF